MKQIIDTTRSLFKNLSSLAIFAGLYALLLAALYGFIATREAKIWQVLLTLLFAASAPVVFFVLQAAIIKSARTGHIDWAGALRESCKLALLTVPLLLIGWGIAYLLNRWQLHYPAPHLQPAPLPKVPGQAVPIPPTHWPTVLFATARALVFIIALPLVMLQLWVELGKENLLTFIRSGPRIAGKSLARIISRAFAAESVLIYCLGLIVFGLIPYVLLFVKVPLGGTWREVGVFSVRLALVFLFTLVGWVLTLSAFARANDGPVLPDPAPAESKPTAGESKPLGPSEVVV